MRRTYFPRLADTCMRIAVGRLGMIDTTMAISMNNFWLTGEPVATGYVMRITCMTQSEPTRFALPGDHHENRRSKKPNQRI